MAVSGHCLCGAVTVQVADLAPVMSACHCRACQQWSGSVLMSVRARGVTVTGPVQTFASSAFAERAWCATCGSALWIHDIDSDVHDLMPGLFPDLAGLPLGHEVYADRCPSGFAFAGEHPRITAAAYQADNLHVKGECA